MIARYLLCLVLGIFTTQHAEATAQPNILFLVSDDLRPVRSGRARTELGPRPCGAILFGLSRGVCLLPCPKEMGLYGGRAKTPALDAFAASAGTVVFDRAYVQQAICCPSRSSFLTGEDHACLWRNPPCVVALGLASASATCHVFELTVTGCPGTVRPAPRHDQGVGSEDLLARGGRELYDVTPGLPREWLLDRGDGER